MKQTNPTPVSQGQNTRLHIGKMIEAELRSQERSIMWFSRQLHCDRRNIYDIFKRTSIDTHLLLRISCILRRNFFLTIADSLKIPVSQQITPQKDSQLQ